jgi:hypothetical protein
MTKMNLKPNLPHWIGTFLLGLAFLLPGTPDLRAQAVYSLLIAKGQYCFQESDALPEGLLLDNTTGPVQFLAESFGEGLTAGHLRVPGIPEFIVMEADIFEGEAEFFHERRFGLELGEFTPDGPTMRMNAAFPGGTYFVTNITSTGGRIVRSLTLAALSTNVLPKSPFISNLAALREMDPTQPFTLRWIEHGPGTSSEFVQISIEDEFGDEVIFSPDLGEPGQLTGASPRQFVIPADTLQAGTRYEGRLLFANVVVNTVSGGTRLVGGFFMETGFEINPIPPGGRIALTATNFSVNEGGSSLDITLTRYGGSSGVATVELHTVNGTATHGADYSGSPEPTVVTFADGETNISVNITITDDTDLEGNETFRVVLEDPTGADLGRAQAVVTIVDNENPNAPVFNLALTNITVPESQATLVVTVNRTGDLTATNTVQIATKDPGTALAFADFGFGAAVLTFAPGERTKTFPVAIVNDALEETDEDFLVCLNAPSEGSSIGPRQTARVLIIDNDTAGRFSFSAAMYTVSELSNSVRVLVRRTGGGAGSARVRVTSMDDTADEDDDYGGVDEEFTFGSNVVEQAITLPIYGDMLAEGDETFRVSLSIPEDSGGALPGPITNATVKIIDDEISIGFRSLTYSNSEAGPVANITVERSGPLTAAAAVQYATTDDTAQAGHDYLGTNGTLHLPAGLPQKTFAVRLINDALVEGNETVRLALHSPSNALLVVEKTNAVLTIGDNDRGGVLQFSSTNITATEAARLATLTVTRTDGLASNVTVCLILEDGPEVGGAVNPDDYTPTNTAGTVTNKIVLAFRVGEPSKLVRVPLLNDQLAEGIETFRARLEEPTGGASLGTRSNTVVQIRDNDQGGKINFSRAAYTVNENGTNLLVTIARTGGAASNVTVIFKSFSNATATAGVDFTAATTPITFGPGQTSTNILVPIQQDDFAEGDERFQLSLMDPLGGGMIGPVSNAVVTIVDDESSISFTNAMYMVNETGPSVTINAVRSGARLTQVSVEVTIQNITASGADHRGTNLTLTFAPNVAFKSITIPIVNDLLDENDEDFTVSLGNPQGGVQLGTVTNTTVVIKDNDAGGVIQFSAANYTATEGAAASILITRSLPPGSPPGTTLATNVSVQFMTFDNTAMSGLDYTTVASNVTFGAGQTMKTVAVPTLTDGLMETPELATLELDSPTGGATLGTNDVADLTINDRPDPNAVPLAGAEFFNSMTVGVTNLTFSRTFNVTEGTLTDVFFENTGVPGNYRIAGMRNINQTSPLIVGIEYFYIGVNGFTGPGTYMLTSQRLEADALYVRGTNDEPTNFGYGAFDEGVTGTVTIDAMNDTTITGRFNVIISDDDDPTKWVRSTGSFRALMR